MVSGTTLPLISFISQGSLGDSRLNLCLGLSMLFLLMPHTAAMHLQLPGEELGNGSNQPSQPVMFDRDYKS